LYEKWLDWKTTPNNVANIRRIKKEWNAYYLKQPLSKDILEKPFARITTLDLRNWAESLMKEYQPDKKKFSRMFEIINQCYEYAADEDRAIVSENLWQKARKKLNKSLIVSKPIPSDESQVFTDDERRQIKIMVREDLERYKKQPTSAGLQILFLFETGLRIGECCGLKWSDIKGNRLYIQRQATNEGVKDKTKTASSCRDIPLTTEAQGILKEINAYNQERGFTKEWIFQSNNPKYDYRLSYNAADRKLRKLCARLETITKSPHKCRKTCISTLLDSPNINNRTVQRFAGHSTLATTYNYYNFERKSKEEQAEAIDKALAL
jgi:integrase